MTDQAKPNAVGEDICNALQPFPDLSSDGLTDVIEENGQTYILGARSVSSGAEVFPARDICPETGIRDMKPARFGPQAVLYSFSAVHISATRELPYTLGYIDFPSGFRTLAHVRSDGAPLHCDLPVLLQTDDNGDWWVEPVRDTA